MDRGVSAHLLFDCLQFTLIRLIFQVHMQCCFLQHWIYFYHQTHRQPGIISASAQPLHAFWIYFSALLQQHIGHLPMWGVHLSVSYIFAFSYCSWLLKARMPKWFAIPFSSGSCFVRTLYHDASISGGPTWHGS